MRRIVVTLVGALTFGALPVAAQPPVPKPGPEQKMLHKFEGTWDGKVSFMGAESKGTATYKMGVGGFFLFLEYRGEFGGEKFEGRGTTGYDPLKKKYVSTWVDSMGPSIIMMEGAFSKDGKTYTETGEGPGMDGKQVKMKSVYEFKDDDTILFTMSNSAEGKDQAFLKITYTRKK
jgi:hypothetical protein